MLNLKYINENIDFVKDCINQKKCDVDIDNIILLDSDRKSLINKVEKLKAKRNQLNKEISKNRNDNTKDISSLIKEMKEISIEIKDLDKSLVSINDTLSKQLLYIPNNCNLN